MKVLSSMILLASFFVLSMASAAGHQYAQIDTCYHWLEPQQLDYKIAYAESHNGDLQFYNNQAIYCWRSPLGAYSSWEDHGDVLIRIKFKKGTRVVQHARQPDLDYMGKIGSVIYSNNEKWQEYTIAPEAVESWSMYHPKMIAEMKAELAQYQADEVTANDVFYPFAEFNLRWIEDKMTSVIRAHNVEAAKGKTKIYGKNPGNHFATAYTLPWQKFFDRTKVYKVVVLPKIKIVEASYGVNVNAKNLGNATVKAAKFCDGKEDCSYKISPKFLDDPAPGQDKSFKIAWRCGSDEKVNTRKVDAPADDEVLQLSCF
jgi:hypothetical protein